MWFNTAPVTGCKKACSEIRGLARFFYLARGWEHSAGRILCWARYS